MILAVASAAFANEIRFGVFVGNDEGQPGDVELIFAEADAAKMRDLFVEYGGMKAGDAALLQGRTAGAVEHELNRISSQIRSVVDDGHEATLVFYYSGHGDATSLHLGTTRIEHENLKTMLEHSGAQVRIAMLDACQSGGMVRHKGGLRGPSFAFAEPEVESVHGTAILTSSAASELSQESTEIGGGFFTHYLHTALSGAADRNGDGEVSLTEAYLFVHTETAFRTRDAPEEQTPSWDLDLAGAGDVMLTSLEEASAHVTFLGDLEGEYAVWDAGHHRYVAQVDGESASTLAVRPGTYFVHKRMNGWVEEARYVVRRGETHSVLAEDFQIVTYASAASRGDLERAVRHSRLPDLSLSFQVGARGWGTGNNAFAQSYFAPHAIGGLQATWMGSRAAYGRVDLRTGGATGEIEIGGLPVEVHQSTSSLGGTLGVATPPMLFRVGAGARAVGVAVSRSLEGFGPDTQARASFGAGWELFAGIQHGRFDANLQLDWQTVVMKWDDNQGWPSYTDLLLSAGWRF
ncbi:MAG: caspase family protein [Myxococcales bacterium]|nr:caspase family protein [Myxococcales bacterium]